MSQMIMTAIRTSTQLGIEVPPIDVVRVNHSMTFLPKRGATGYPSTAARCHDDSAHPSEAQAAALIWGTCLNASGRVFAHKRRPRRNGGPFSFGRNLFRRPRRIGVTSSLNSPAKSTIPPSPPALGRTDLGRSFELRPFYYSRSDQAAARGVAGGHSLSPAPKGNGPTTGGKSGHSIEARRCAYRTAGDIEPEYLDGGLTSRQAARRCVSLVGVASPKICEIQFNTITPTGAVSSPSSDPTVDAMRRMAFLKASVRSGGGTMTISHPQIRRGYSPRETSARVQLSPDQRYVRWLCKRGMWSMLRCELAELVESLVEDSGLHPPIFPLGGMGA